MKTIKTARGRTLNMGQLAAQHEQTRAVSNVPVNAKGDIIDNRGNVKVPREEISKEYYRDNLTGIEEPVSIKEDTEPPVVEEEISKQETVEPETKPKPKAKKKAAPKTTPEPVESDEPIEMGRRQRTRDDGSTYWEIEYSDGSMGTEDN